MLSPSEVQLKAKQLKKENIKFRSFLKNLLKKTLDEQFLALHNELFANYDCCKCGNCCRSYSTILQDSEIEEIAAKLGMSKDEFIQKHLTERIEGYELKAPCEFLNADGKCSIEDFKPQECKDFPCTDKPERLFSLYGIIDFAEHCPVVFEILQRLKAIYRFNLE